MRKTVSMLTLGVSTLVAALSCVADQAKAATLAQKSGSVLVNIGPGFVPGADQQLLPPGTRVLVKDKSTATIAYGSLCVVTIDATKTPTGKLYVIEEQAPCLSTLPEGAGDYAVAATIGIGAAAGLGAITKSSASP